MIKLRVMAAIFGLLLGLSGVAHGALTTYDFTGTVSTATDSNNFGKLFEAKISVDETNTLSSWEYLIGGNVIESFGPDSVTKNTSSVKTTPFSFLSSKGIPGSLGFYNYSLTYDPTNDNHSFLSFALKNGQLSLITADIKKQIVTPIPAAAWLLGSGLLGMLGLKRRQNEA